MCRPIGGLSRHLYQFKSIHQMFNRHLVENLRSTELLFSKSMMICVAHASAGYIPSQCVDVVDGGGARLMVQSNTEV